MDGWLLGCRFVGSNTAFVVDVVVVVIVFWSVEFQAKQFCGHIFIVKQFNWWSKTVFFFLLHPGVLWAKWQTIFVIPSVLLRNQFLSFFFSFFFYCSFVVNKSIIGQLCLDFDKSCIGWIKQHAQVNYLRCKGTSNKIFSVRQITWEKTSNITCGIYYWWH